MTDQTKDPVALTKNERALAIDALQGLLDAHRITNMKPPSTVMQAESQLDRIRNAVAKAEETIEALKSMQYQHTQTSSDIGDEAFSAIVKRYENAGDRESASIIREQWNMTKQKRLAAPQSLKDQQAQPVEPTKLEVSIESAIFNMRDDAVRLRDRIYTREQIAEDLEVIAHQLESGYRSSKAPVDQQSHGAMPEGWRKRLQEMREASYTYSNYPELAQVVFDSVIDALDELDAAPQPSPIDKEVVAQIISELREQAHEYRQADSTVGIFADPETADMLEEWADRLEALCRCAPASNTGKEQDDEHI
jgi:DNA-binding ferritin-like protein